MLDCPPDAPVLVIGFKRLDELRRVLEATGRHHAGRIYVFLDHPRAGRDDETAACSALRSWVQEWAAKDAGRVRVKLAPSNLGCARAIPAGMQWVFSAGHEAVIFLEDDCLPAPSFFPFMQAMLARYAGDTRVMMVSGNQFLPRELIQQQPYSYYFSRFIHIWGWGTWKRAWAHYDHTLSALDERFVAENLDSLLPGRAETAFYSAVWSRQKANPQDTAWGSRWLLACLIQRGLCICPSRNLVRNIGFGEGSTHTSRASAYHVVPLQRLETPLVHPPHVVEWRAADRWWFDHLVSKRIDLRVRRLLNRVDPDRVLDEA
jgi:GT2 family glycosyltransferase